MRYVVSAPGAGIPSWPQRAALVIAIQLSTHRSLGSPRLLRQYNQYNQRVLDCEILVTSEAQ